MSRRCSECGSGEVDGQCRRGAAALRAGHGAMVTRHDDDGTIRISARKLGVRRQAALSRANCAPVLDAEDDTEWGKRRGGEGDLSGLLRRRRGRWKWYGGKQTGNGVVSSHG
jgi:hypothetical protein